MADHSNYLDRPVRDLAEVLAGRFRPGDRIVHPQYGGGEILHLCSGARTHAVALFADRRRVVWLGDLARAGGSTGR